MATFSRLLPHVAWSRWSVMEGLWGCFFARGGCMQRNPEPCSCRLARSGLRENRQLASVPSVLQRLMAGASVIMGHLVGSLRESVKGGEPTDTKTTELTHSRPIDSWAVRYPAGSDSLLRWNVSQFERRAVYISNMRMAVTTSAVNLCFKAGDSSSSLFTPQQAGGC